MKVARPVWLVLLAFVVLVVLAALFFTPLSPFAPSKTPNAPAPTAVAAKVTRPATKNAPALTAVPTEAPPALATDEAISAPTPPNDNPSAAFQQGLTLRRNGDYPRAAVSFRAALDENPEPALAREAQYRLGEAHYLGADFTNALTAFNALVQENDGDDFAARAHYFLGDMYAQKQQYDDALTHLRAYRQKTSALAGYIDQEIADVLLASGDSAAAIKQYDVALQDKTLVPARRVAILEKIAEVERSRTAPGRAARLSDAFEIAPDDKTRAEVEYNWGVALAEADDQNGAIEHWKHALATYTDEPGAHQSVAKLVEVGAPNINDVQRGIANYYVGNYDLAIQAFRRYIAAVDKVNPDALYFAGLAYLSEGGYDGALRNLNALLSTYPQDKRVPDALYYKAVSLARQGSYDAALTAYRQLHKRLPEDARFATGLWNIATTLEVARQHPAAAKVYQELTAAYPSGTYGSMASFNAGLNLYLAGTLPQAQAQWTNTLAKYPGTQDGDGAAYWSGKIAQANGDKTAANKFYEQSAQAPRTYYSWRALDALGQQPPPPSYDLDDYAMSEDPQEIAELEQWLTKTTGVDVSRTLPQAVFKDANFARGSELAALDRALEARAGLAKVAETFRKDPHALYALAWYFRDTNYFSLSIDAAKRLALLTGQTDNRLPRVLRQFIYPTYFADLVVPYAKRHNFDPNVFFGLMRQESGFNPMSYSSAEARGLTQVIPGTAEGIARALGVTNFEQTDLFKPYVSVRFGTYYLGVVLDQFDGSVPYALMGYNGGPGNARKWQDPDLDVAVEKITLPETHLYVRTVYAQYRQYDDIYHGTDK